MAISCASFLFVAILASIIIIPFLPQKNVLKIYNWEDYMVDDAGVRFEKWYKEQTGKTIKVEFSSFSTNEEAYSQIKTKKENYDIFVPSDYMIDRMRKEELLLPLNRDILFENGNEYDIFNQDIVEIIGDSYDPNFGQLDQNGNIIQDNNPIYDQNSGKPIKDDHPIYSVPYLWGTVGILYDPTRGTTLVTDEDALTWESLFSDKYKNKIYMKDSVHDAFAIGSIYANFPTRLKPLLLPIEIAGQDEYGNNLYKQAPREANATPIHIQDSDIFVDDNGILIDPNGNYITKSEYKDSDNNDYLYTQEYLEELRAVISDTSDENIEITRQSLISQRKNLLKYANEDSKDAMAVGGEMAGLLSLAWSTDAGYAMADNSNLRFQVPKEGSNIYIDAFVIPKYARNYEAANYFLKFISLFDEENEDLQIPFENMDYAGAPSPVTAAADAYKEYLEEDPDEFFVDKQGINEEFKQNYIDMFFAPAEVFKRTAYFLDFAEASITINKMWINVKAGQTENDQIHPAILITVAVIIVGGIFVWVCFTKSKKSKRRHK